MTGYLHEPTVELGRFNRWLESGFVVSHTF